MSSGSSEQISSTQIFYIVLTALFGAFGNFLKDVIRELSNDRLVAVFVGGIIAGLFLGLLISVLAFQARTNRSGAGGQRDARKPTDESASRKIPILLPLAVVGGLFGSVLIQIGFGPSCSVCPIFGWTESRPPSVLPDLAFPIPVSILELAAAVVFGIAIAKYGDSLLRRAYG